MSEARVAAWAASHSLEPIHVDCATAVMLKIIDGKCKMAAGEKLVMAQLYEQIRGRAGKHLGADVHALIAMTSGGADEAMKSRIYEMRVLAETAISRPVMKAFKAMIRQDGLLDGIGEEESDNPWPRSFT